MASYEQQPDYESGNPNSHQSRTHRYHDEPDEEDSSVDANTPLRPSLDFDGLTRASQLPWQARLQDRIPPKAIRAWEATVKWVKGPQPPRIFHIDPVFPKIQHAPLALLDRYAPKRIHRFWLLILLYACWMFSFSMVLRSSSFAAQIPGYGSPTRLNCGTRYWEDRNGCGLNGNLCRPFTNATLAFRCPADCHKELMLVPHAVGDQELVYKPLVVGGHTDRQTGFEDVIVDNAVYRGDSFICASAVHAGFINDAEGGCGVLSLTGEQELFTASKTHGIESMGFDSWFPHSFGFLSGSRAQCKDLRWSALAPSVIFTALLSLFTTSPAVHFWSLFVGLFFHVSLASDPPALTDYYSLLSIAFGRFLPACFCAWITYRYAAKYSLTGLTAQIEKTVLWLGPAWVGALNNYTFDRIPIQRLTPHDIQAQPGAVPALIFIVLSIFAIALGQAWSFRLEGRMPRYLLVYGIFVASLLFMVAVPGLSLRIHHYILGLLLLPGTSFQNRPSLIYQGLLIGLFINGTAKWGFASILETPAALLDGFQKDTLLPYISIATMGVAKVTFNIGQLPKYDPKLEVTYDGISVLVNDVERFRGYVDDPSYWNDGTVKPGQNLTWTWTRHGRDVDDDGGMSLRQESNTTSTSSDSHVDLAVDVLPEYFRFAYMAGSQTADFSKAGKWDGEGHWKEMEAGPSK